MAILRFDPFSTSKLLRPLWFDEDDRWPDITMTDGIDVFEEDGKVCVKAAVPGVPADKVDVTYEDGVLTVRARVENRDEGKEKKRVVYKRERVASFNYTTVLPRPIDEKSLKAEVEDGVVVVTAQVAEQARPKKISVKTKSK